MIPSYLFSWGSCLSCKNKKDGDWVIANPSGAIYQVKSVCREHVSFYHDHRDRDTGLCLDYQPILHGGE